jgi:hypothetical protein
MARTSDSNVKMIVVRKRAVRLLHDLGSSNAQSERCPNALGVRKQPCSKWRGDENVRDVRRLVADHGRDQRPILCIVEVRARPANRSGVAAELNEVAREKLPPVGSVNEEADVGVATALVRSVALDTTATLAGQMADRGDGFRELPADRPRGTVDHGYQRLQSPAHVAFGVRRNDPQVGGLVKVHPSREMSFCRRPEAAAEPEGGWTEGCKRCGSMSWRDARQRSRRERERRS